MTQSIAPQHILAWETSGGDASVDLKEAAFLLHSAKLSILLGDIVNDCYSGTALENKTSSDVNVNMFRAPTVIHRI